MKYFRMSRSFPARGVGVFHDSQGGTLMQNFRMRPKPPTGAGSDLTTVPAPPSSGYEPTRGEPLPPLPLSSVGSGGEGGSMSTPT
mgnify:CR=1 FL=1